MNLDWTDILIHAAVSLVVSALLLLAGIPALWLLLASLAGWLGREIWQHRKSPLDVLARPQSLMEWLTPVTMTLFVIAVIGERQ